MEQTSSVLYAANCKQERTPCSDESTILQLYPTKHDACVKSKVSNCETNFISISKFKPTFEY